MTDHLAVARLDAIHHALQDIKKLLEEQHVCGHGTRGWCPYCYLRMREGGLPG